MSIIEDLLVGKGISEALSKYLAYAIATFVIIILSIIVHLILTKVVLRIISKIIRSNNFEWDDVLLARGVFKKAFQMAPGIIIYSFAPIFEEAEKLIRIFSSTYILIIMMFLASSLLEAVNDIYQTKEISKTRPIKGVLQVVKIAFYIVIGIVIIANIMDKNPLVLLGGIGAATAVFSFVFKDAILGFVAGIQLTSNDMIQIGDWISMPNYGADGNVIDISLTTVKVQNFDKTITMIPAYSMVSNSFVNWRGMHKSGGRRIKRSIFIDVNTIKFCTDEMLKKYKKIDYIKEYIEKKEKEIKEYNKEHNVDTDQKVNGRRLTNIGTFRAYIQNYLKNNPKINDNMIQMVRQLAPEENGIPRSLCFTSTTNWVEYEGIQSDMFDHILSVAEEFDLKLFQNPSGNDMRAIASN